MLRSLLLPLLAISALASLSAAQDWNRRVSDVHIVHPPGTPPGTWRVAVDVEVSANDMAPAPLDLGFDVEIDLNGTQIALLGTEAVQQIPQPCNWATCNGGYCSSYLVNNTQLYVGSCKQTYFGSGQSMCGCAIPLDISGGPWSSFLNPTDQVSATVHAHPGSLPEVEMSDDSFTIQPRDNPIGTPYCFGDGTLPTACPCSNFGQPGHGCANSSNPNGAMLRATGWSQPDPLTGTDSVVLHASGMSASMSGAHFSSSIAIYMASRSSSGSGAMFGSGVTCLAGQVARMRVKTSVGGVSSFPELGEPSLGAASHVVLGSAVTLHYAVYYGQEMLSCSALHYNATNAVSLDW